MTPQQQNSVRETRETNRLEAFSDGVFAIAITLLVLNIQVPQPVAGKTLEQALGDQWLTYLAFLLSFLTILNLWVSHHNMFRLIARSDNLFPFINGLLLLGVVILPFPTALLARYFGNPADRFIVTLVYAGVFTFNSVTYFLLWLYASTRLRLLDSRLDPVKIRNLSLSYLASPPFYIVALVLVFIQPIATLIIYVLLMVFYLISALFLPRTEQMFRGDAVPMS